MFIVILGAVLALMHLYVWKRLIHNTTGGRPPLRVGAPPDISVITLQPEPPQAAGFTVATAG